MVDKLLKASYVIGLVVASAVRASYRRQTRRNAIADERGSTADRLLVSLPSLGLVILPALYLLTRRLDFADFRLPTKLKVSAGALGIAIYVTANWLLWRSHVDLGRNWSPTLEIREKHTLVTQGVFRYVRHPMYAAHWLWAVAQPLLLQNWIAGLATLASFPPLYFWRVPREERMMLEHFGDEYRAYASRTGRVIPSLHIRLKGSG